MRHTHLLAATTVLAVFAPVATATQPQQGALAIEHVTVIDPTAATNANARLLNHTVLIEGSRIIQVGPADAVTIAETAIRIDGRGKFLVPGFWDMHVHFNRNRNTQVRVMAPLMIANGITGVRDMLGDCWEPCRPGRLDLATMHELQRQIESGEILAPRILALSSPILRGPRNAGGYPQQYPPAWRPTTEAEGHEVARYLKERGVDLVKTYNGMTREGFFGLMAEANELDLAVSGHLPWSVHPIEAANAGMRAIEHARWPGLACNPVYEEFRAMYAAFATLESEWDGDLFAKFRDASWQQFDQELCAAIFRALVANDVYLVPTHLTREMDARAIDSSYRADPRRRYVPGWRLRGWDRDLTGTAGGPPELQTFYRQFFDVGLRVTGMAHEAGVNVLVGTDAFDTMVFPGLSYHDELVHLSNAGLSNLAILRAATYQAAVFLDRTDDFGSVAAGKMADVVLLDADPLLDIRKGMVCKSS